MYTSLENPSQPQYGLGGLYTRLGLSDITNFFTISIEHRSFVVCEDDIKIYTCAQICRTLIHAHTQLYTVKNKCIQIWFKFIVCVKSKFPSYTVRN